MFGKLKNSETQGQVIVLTLQKNNIAPAES